MVEELRTQLSQDALTIVGSEPNSTTQNSAVCLCVALRDKYQHVKKFVFHNGAGVLPLKMREKAHELGYDVVQAEQSHAEGQWIQFLLRRNEVRPGWYTHIIGMGCSKCHCAECDVLFKLFLGEGYHAVTTSVNEKKSGGNNTVVTSITNEPRDPGEAGADENKKFTQISMLKTEYEVVKGEETIDTASYDNYYLPERLKKALCSIMTNLKLDKLSGVHFNINRTKEEEKEETKRKERAEKNK